MGQFPSSPCPFTQPLYTLPAQGSHSHLQYIPTVASMHLCQMDVRTPF